MIYFYDDIDATNTIRISNSEIAELDLVAKIKESDLDKYLKKYLKKDTNVWFYYDLSDLAEDYDCQYVQNDEFGLWYTDENKKYHDIWKKSIKEEYDPTDDIVNKGNSVSMDYETFIKFTDGLDIRFNRKDAKIVYLSNDIKMEFGDSVLVIPKDDILDIVVNAHSSMEIKSKFIEQVASVSLDKNNILRADFFTKEGNVLTVWWEV